MCEDVPANKRDPNCLYRGGKYLCIVFCVCLCAGCVSAPARARVLVSESVLCCGGV